jgi:hypothetical protein
MCLNRNMTQEELEEANEESPEFIAFMQREVTIGVEAADRGDFSIAFTQPASATHDQTVSKR